MNCFSVGYEGELTDAAIQFHAFQALKQAKTQLKRNTEYRTKYFASKEIIEIDNFYKILIIKL